MVKLPSDSDNRLVIAAIGEAGEGKSTLLNLILNRYYDDSDDDSDDSDHDSDNDDLIFSPGDSEVFFDVSDEPEACTVSPSFRY